MQGVFKFLLRSTISGPIVRLIARSIADHWNAEMGGEAPSVLDDVRILCMLNSESLPQWNPTCKGKNLGARAVAFKLHFGRAFNAFLSRLIAFSQHRSGRIHPVYLTDPQVHQAKTRHQKPGQSGMRFVTLPQVEKERGRVQLLFRRPLSFATKRPIHQGLSNKPQTARKLKDSTVDSLMFFPSNPAICFRESSRS